MPYNFAALNFPNQALLSCSNNSNFGFRGISPSIVPQCNTNTPSTVPLMNKHEPCHQSIISHQLLIK